jgi:signal transduction histidine kinase
VWSVLMMATIVGFIGIIDLGNEVQQQFDAAHERAGLLRRVATFVVIQTLNRQSTAPLREALRDPDLSEQLVDLATAAQPVLEIAVVDRDNEILAGSDPTQMGKTFEAYPDFGPAVTQTSWWGKLGILFGEKRYYQLEQPVGAGDETLLSVRVVVYPGLIRNAIEPGFRKNVVVAAGSILGAMLVALLFSTIAFRPLGRLGLMIDQLARGEYEPPETAPANPSGVDELGMMASKVSLLGQQLRGARYDFSDLRGNFERLLDQLEDAVFIFGRERRLVAASGAVEKFLGRMRSDLLGQSLSDIFPPNTTLGLLLSQASQTGRTMHNRRVPIAQDGGAGPVLLLSVEILESLADPAAGARSGMLVRLRDPEATQQISRRLQMADRLSAISGITGGVAHEVKNPLNAILMHVELAKMKLAQGNYDLEAHMETISGEILRLDRVVKTFLDFTRPLELSLREVAVDEFLEEIVNLARPQADAAGIRVSVKQDAAGTDIRVDRDLMKQAVLNVVVNAIEAMPEGGELHFDSAVHEDQAEIRIRDTGPGIPPEVREKIFRLYFTTKKEGSGIGLAMTYRVVQLHDGTIEVSSEPGEGTTFALRFPLAV